MPSSSPSRRPRYIPLLLALALLGRAYAEDGAADPAPQAEGGSVSLFAVPASTEDPASGEEAGVYAEELRSSLQRRLTALGYAVQPAEAALSPELPEATQAAALARASGSAWAAVCALSLAQGRLSYRIAIYDAAEGSLAAGDSFSVLSGLGALRTMDDSAASAAARLADYRAGRAALIHRVVSYRVAIRCPAEGATVRVDSPGLKSASPGGTIRNGHLLLPYYPFLQGSTLLISATSVSGQRMAAKVVLGPEAPLVELMPPRPRLDFLVGTGTGRLMGAGAELRTYIVDEWSYFFLEDRLYAGFDFQAASSPLIHQEVWNGVGCYLFFPPSSRFRLDLGLGWGILLSIPTIAGSSSAFADLALLPLDLVGEFSLSRDSAAWLSVSSAFAVGNGGLLARGWMGNGAPAVSLGLLWRRR